MKFILRVFVVVLTWPLVFLTLLGMSAIWLVFYCWGYRDSFHLSTGELKKLSYCLLHFKIKEGEWYG